MEKCLKQVSYGVITNGKQYLRKIDSSRSISKVLYHEEEQYEVSAHDEQVELLNGSFADAIRITFCKDEDGATSFADVLTSDVLGTYISDWY